MTEEARRREKLVGLCALAAVLFNPPLLDLFSGGTVLGWPSLYVYIFLVWAALIATIALVADRRHAGAPDAEGED